MMKRKHTRSSQRPAEDTPQVDISSLVDVSFLLLIYFLVASTIIKKEQDLDMSILTNRGDRIPEAPPLVVQVEKNGEIVVNPTVFPETVARAGGDSELSGLAKRLRLLKAGQGSAASVMLRVSKEVDYQRFIDVINCLAGEEIEKLALVDL